MPIKPRTWAIIVGGALVLAIVGVGIYAWRSSCHAPNPPWPDYASGEGVKYCARLGDLARERSMLHTVVASILALLGSCAMIVGNLLEPLPPDAGRRWFRNRGALLLNFGGLLVVMSYYEFSRADAASLTAASTAMAQADAARPHAPGTPEPPPDAQDREAYVLRGGSGDVAQVPRRVERPGSIADLDLPEQGEAFADEPYELNAGVALSRPPRSIP